ncbi:hypothetical protein [Streptomyces sp. NPDC057580]|uniref:hypothetical protein n=1 Tax=Streptomyces sp. NPDC057580 TaxID=3346173 RepID=UPI00368E1AC6
MDGLSSEATALIKLGGLALRKQGLITEALRAYAKQADSLDERSEALDVASEIREIIEQHYQ